MAIDFSKYQKKQLDLSQYQKREAGNTLRQLLQGFGASGWGVVRGAGLLGAKGIDKVFGSELEQSARSGDGVLSDKFGRYLEPQTGVEQGAKLGADIAQFFAPTSVVNKATKGMKFIPRVLGRTAPDVAIAGLQAEGAGEDAGTVAGVTGLTSAVGNALLPGRPMGMLSSTAAGGVTGYVGDVATGLTGMRGEDREGAAAFIPGFGTAAGVGLGAAGGYAGRNQMAQERMTQAVDDLEQKYNDISRGWVTTRKMSDKAKGTTAAKNKSGTQGRTPERVLAESGIVPQLDGSKFSTKQQAEQLIAQTQPLRQANRQALLEASYGTQPIKIDDLEKAAIRRARSDRNIAGGSADKLEKLIRREFNTYRKNYGDTMTLLELDDVKSARWSNVGFSLTKDDRLASDADYLIAKAAQRQIEDVARTAGAKDVAQLNRDIGDILEASKYLQTLDGRAVLYGRMGTHMTRLAGAVAGSGGGPLGSIAGAMGGDVLAGLLRSNYIASPTKRIILRNLRTQDPNAYISTLKWIKQQGLEREMRELLPAPRYMEMGAPRTQDASGVSMAPAARTSMQNPQTGRFGRAYTSDPRYSQGNTPSTMREYPAQTTTANSSASNIQGVNQGTEQNASKLSSSGIQTAMGGFAGFGVDEEGNVTFNPEMALVGIAGMAASSKLYKTKVKPSTIAKNIDSKDFRAINEFLDATSGDLKIEQALNDPRIKSGLKFLQDAGLDSDMSPEGITLARQYLQDVTNELPTDKGMVRKLPVSGVDEATETLVQEAKKYKTAEEFVKAKTISSENLKLFLQKRLDEKLSENRLSDPDSYIAGELSRPKVDDLWSEFIDASASRTRNSAKDIFREYVDNAVATISHAVAEKLTKQERTVATLLSKAWDINSITPHGYRSNSFYRSMLMKEKERLITDAIALNKKIRNSKIQVWNNNGVTYFNIGGRQVSFHGNYGTTHVGTIPEEWIGARTKINPLKMTDEQYLNLKNFSTDQKKLADVGYEKKQFFTGEVLPDTSVVLAKAEDVSRESGIPVDILLRGDKEAPVTVSSKLEHEFADRTGISREELFPYMSRTKESNMRYGLTAKNIEEKIDDSIIKIKRALYGGDYSKSFDELMGNYKTKKAKGYIELVEKKKRATELLNRLTSEDGKNEIINIFEEIVAPTLDEIKRVDKKNATIDAFNFWRNKYFEKIENTNSGNDILAETRSQLTDIWNAAHGKSTNRASF